MMVNPGTGDSSTVFALLTAISSPDQAKASLQEIVDASTAYQKTIEDFRTESAKTKSDLSALKDQADAQFAAAKKISDDFNATSGKKTQELSDKEASLSTREAIVRGKEDSLKAREDIVANRENAVQTREQSVSQREAEASKLKSDAETAKTLYQSKLDAMKNIIN